MLVFRDGRQAVNGPQLLGELTNSLRRLSSTSTFSSNLVVDALLRAGELECALADARDPAARPVADITDVLAAALVKGHSLDTAPLERTIRALTIPERITLCRPEGFAYYALHPLDFAELATSLTVRSRRVAVVGIRSIGTTLSAMVTAAAGSKGIASQRITVRPTWHPRNRGLDLTPGERAWING